MNIALITGSAGLIGSEAVSFFAEHFDYIIGIDNNMRSYFFGHEASTDWKRIQLESQISNYKHYSEDIRDYPAMERIFLEFGSDLKFIVHTAAQPSHDWAVTEPLTDFTINANGTLNLLELTRKYCPSAVFIYTSTNKVYGDTPNSLPLVELDTRWEIDPAHRFYRNGIDESMSIDNSKHSLFGASKVAADVMSQEYGRYFGMNVGVFRGGCLTGPNHSGTRLHGFLSYLMKCAITGDSYTIYGYKGKQVRDNIHSRDLVNMFWHFYQAPKQGEAYNAGGGRHSHCSMQEAITLCEKITGKKMNISYADENRIGDHIWYVSDLSKFKSHYPEWIMEYNLEDILLQIYNSFNKRI
ncbi:MAG TPA: NAD-dependent epimerase/dehydratase family protein [Bacteroidales bacterium]|nr:NAD-dependent epimerase/dehydratase family protein [Bacteroidales bacterium]